jgi:hypothetical protein
VLAAVAAPRGLGVVRLGRLTYLGPPSAAERLPRLAAMRAEEIARLPAGQRSRLRPEEPLDWPRLAQPRDLVAELVGRRGWRLEQVELVPHDLWAAGALPELPLAEQLTVLLIGFDLSFEVRGRERALKIVPLDEAALERSAGAKRHAGREADAPPRQGPATSTGTRRVYTLRVAEQPVRAVLQELGRRLNWPIEIDERAIGAAGRSVDERVSFAVENATQEELLEALLRPAGLSFRRDGERIRVVPRDGAAR